MSPSTTPPTNTDLPEESADGAEFLEMFEAYRLPQSPDADNAKIEDARRHNLALRVAIENMIASVNKLGAIEKAAVLNWLKINAKPSMGRSGKSPLFTERLSGSASTGGFIWPEEVPLPIEDDESDILERLPQHYREILAAIVEFKTMAMFRIAHFSTTEGRLILAQMLRAERTVRRPGKGKAGGIHVDVQEDDGTSLVTASLLTLRENDRGEAFNAFANDWKKTHPLNPALLAQMKIAIEQGGAKPYGEGQWRGAYEYARTGSDANFRTLDAKVAAIEDEMLNPGQLEAIRTDFRAKVEKLLEGDGVAIPTSHAEARALIEITREARQGEQTALAKAEQAEALVARMRADAEAFVTELAENNGLFGGAKRRAVLDAFLEAIKG